MSRFSFPSRDSKSEHLSESQSRYHSMENVMTWRRATQDEARIE